MTITTQFEICQKVYIPSLKTSGRVMAFYLSTRGGLQYFTRFFRENLSAETEYFFEDELSSDIPKEKSSGF